MATRGVFALIKDNENRLLVCERADGKGWNLPGGRVESGETDQVALIREVLEETGLEVEVRERVGIDRVFGEDTAVAYLCQHTGGVLNTSPEVKTHDFIQTWSEVKSLTWAGGRTLAMVLDGLYYRPPA